MTITTDSLQAGASAKLVLNAIRTVVDEGTYIAEFNTDIPLTKPEGVARCNVFRPKATEDGQTFPVLMTMGPCMFISTIMADLRRQGHPLLGLPGSELEGRARGAALEVQRLGNSRPTLLDDSRLRRCPRRRAWPWSVARESHVIFRNLEPQPR